MNRLTRVVVLFLATALVFSASETVIAANWNKSKSPKIEFAVPSEIIFPKYFATSRFDKTCAISSLTTNLEKKVVGATRQLLQSSDIGSGSDSLTVIHRTISDPWKLLLDASVTSQTLGNIDDKNAVIKSLVALAEADAFLSGSTSDGKCYAGGNTKAKCGAHSANHRSFGVAALLMIAANMREELSPAEVEVVNGYARRAYKKLLKPETEREILMTSSGFYEFGHGSIVMLAHANWLKDEDLLIKAYQGYRNRLSRVLEPSGYIDHNSYRGVRGFFYHVLGLDSAISAALIFDAYGFETLADQDLYDRFYKAFEKVDEGLTNYEKFQSKGFRGKNISTDPMDEIWSVHPLASNLHFIALNWFGKSLAYTPSGRLTTPGASKLSGLDAKCFYLSR